MLIEYKANKSKRRVTDNIGNALIKRGLARAVYSTRDMQSAVPAPVIAVEPIPAPLPIPVTTIEEPVKRRGRPPKITKED